METNKNNKLTSTLVSEGYITKRPARPRLNNGEPLREWFPSEMTVKWQWNDSSIGVHDYLRTLKKETHKASRRHTDAKRKHLWQRNGCHDVTSMTMTDKRKERKEETRFGMTRIRPGAETMKTCSKSMNDLLTIRRKQAQNTNPHETTI